MKTQYLIYLFLLLLLSFFLSCNPDVDVNFLINGQDLKPSEEQPADLTNIEEILVVYAGDSIIFTDISRPEKSVKKRFWEIDGETGWDRANQDERHFSSTINREGIYQIKLCVNKEGNCISKWLKVEPWGPAPTDNPVVTFSNPSELYNSTKNEYIDIKVETENIFSKDELTLLIKEVTRGFDFDEATGILTKKVRLGSGENRIEVQARGGDELVSEWVVVDYKIGKVSGRGNEGGGTPVPNPIPIPKDKPYIKINSPSKNFNTLESTVALIFKTGNISNNNDIQVEVNGNSFRDYQFNSSRNVWNGNVSLEEGMNKIVVKTSDGRAIDVANVKLLKKAPPPPPPPPPLPAGTPTVKIVSPNGIASTKSQVELTLSTKNLTGPRDLTVLLNGQKVSGIRFAGDRQLWIGKVNLKNGKNIIEAQVKNGNGSSKDQVAIDFENNDIALNSLGTIGLKAKDYSSSCSSAELSNYSFSIIPQRNIELLEFIVFSNICGGLEIILQSAAGVQRTKVELIKGKNQITLSDLNAGLVVGTKYSISLKTLAGYGLCNASSTPQLEDASNCPNQVINKPEIKMDAKGKSIIYDLKYLY